MVATDRAFSTSARAAPDLGDLLAGRGAVELGSQLFRGASDDREDVE